MGANHEMYLYITEHVKRYSIHELEVRTRDILGLPEIESQRPQQRGDFPVAKCHCSELQVLSAH